MTPVIPHSPSLFRLLGAAALASLLMTASAQAGVRYSITVDVVKGQTAIERTAAPANNNNNRQNNNNNNNNRQGGGFGGGGGAGTRGGGANTTNQEVFFDITVRNNDKAELPNVVVEYAIYNETVTNSTQDGRSSQMEEVKGTETIELGPNSKKTIQTRRVSNRDSRPAQTRSSGNNRGGNQQRQPANRTTTTQNIDGWWVVIKVEDQQVVIKESQLGYKKKIEAEMAKQNL